MSGLLPVYEGDEVTKARENDIDVATTCKWLWVPLLNSPTRGNSALGLVTKDRL